MAHATTVDLQAYVNPLPANAQLLLDRASRQIDQALLSAVYDKIDPDVLEALKVATLEQVVGQLAAGVTDGIGAAVPTSFSIGRLSVSRGAKSSNPTAQARKIGDLWEQAWIVLQQAGLTGHEPWVL